MRLLTAKEAAEQLGISLSLVYALCKVGVIHCTRHGRPGRRGCIRIAEEALASYLAQCRGEGRLDASPLGLKHITLN